MDEIVRVPKRLNLRNLRLEKFNLCDPSCVIDALQTFEVGSFCIRDCRGCTWSNRPDTLVLVFKSSKDVKLGVELTKIFKDMGADEINVRYADKKVYMRIWWD